MAWMNDRNGRRTIPALNGLLLCLLCWLSAASAEDAAAPKEQSGDFTKTPYPRVAMLWASIRGDNSVEAMARHDLVMAGTGSLRLRYDGKPQGLADRFTPDSIAAARKRIAEIRSSTPMW